VTEPVQTTWATIADVLAFTNVTVGAMDLTQAAATIDLVAVRLYSDKARIGSRDQEWLKRAVCYQAAWIHGPNSLRLAPYAEWALNRVSWLRSRSLHVRGAGEHFDFDELGDGQPGWSPWRPV